MEEQQNVPPLEWYPYFKATEEVHDGSGFNCFEVGYCTVVDSKIDRKITFGGIVPDHIAIWDSFLEPMSENKLPGVSLGKGLSFDFDCLPGGYIRVFNRYHGLHWMNLREGKGFTMSSMMFAYGWPSISDPLLYAGNN